MDTWLLMVILCTPRCAETVVGVYPTLPACYRAMDGALEQSRRKNPKAMALCKAVKAVRT